MTKRNEINATKNTIDSLDKQIDNLVNTMVTTISEKEIDNLTFITLKLYFKLRHIDNRNNLNTFVFLHQGNDYRFYISDSNLNL